MSTPTNPSRRSRTAHGALRVALLRHPVAVSFGLHVGAITMVCVTAHGVLSVPRAAVRYSVLQPDASAAPAPQPDRIEVLPEPTLEPSAPVFSEDAPPEPPELQPDPVPEAVPPRAAASLPPPPRLEHFALTAVCRQTPVPNQPSTAPPQEPQAEPPPVAEVELAASSPMPDLGNSPAPQYPPAARRHHMQGTVVVLFEVAADGRPLSCTIEVSSGYALLDDAALEAARKWRFAGGAGQARVPFAFELRVGAGS